MAEGKLVEVENILFPLLDEDDDVPGVFLIDRKTRKLLSARTRVKKRKLNESQDRPR